MIRSKPVRLIKTNLIPIEPIMSESQFKSFRTTRWTQVVAAQGDSLEAKKALRDLCEAYYAPLVQFIRRYQTEGDRDGEARELVHEFVTRLLEGDQLKQVDPKKGRFRSYLLGAVKHFLADWRKRQMAQKRGGGRSFTSIDSLSECWDQAADRQYHDGSVEVSDPAGFPADSFFDRQWALNIVDLAMADLRQESESNRNISQFEILKNWLVVSVDRMDTAAASRELQMSADAFKVAVHRLRKRFRQIVTEHIAATVDDPADVSDELNYLIQVIAGANKG